jgi:transcriptional regulator GlxA family with amidase domain
MGEVAVECGFLTLRNFHRAFVRAFGLPPAALRNRKRELAPGLVRVVEPAVRRGGKA